MLSSAATPYLPAATHGSDLAATVHTAGQVATVALILTVCIALYLLTCLVWPFGKCRRCKGAGKFKSPFGNAYRHCGKCDGSGLRVRIGRKVISYYRRTHNAATNSTSKGRGK
ncbi:hypothetical protein [Kribbella catacumbae]|uniref:hypothetical protein n=1 Tax=Kribbella catacumbae TaxID=460086 RepID=UPI00037D65FB|nr:hypothetical protein [Kribbella catacumbae]